MNVAMAAGIILFEGLRQRKFYREGMIQFINRFYPNCRFGCIGVRIF